GLPTPRIKELGDIYGRVRPGSVCTDRRVLTVSSGAHKGLQPGADGHPPTGRSCKASRDADRAAPTRAARVGPIYRPRDELVPHVESNSVDRPNDARFLRRRGLAGEWEASECVESRQRVD